MAHLKNNEINNGCIVMYAKMYLFVLFSSFFTLFAAIIQPLQETNVPTYRPK